MNDLDRLLKASLQDVGDSFTPEDTYAARERFIAARRKRRIAFSASGLALAGAGVAALLFFTSVPVQRDDAQIEAAAAPLAVVAETGVGGAPTSLATEGERVWVTNAEESSVVAIDSASGETVASIPFADAAPDEVAVFGDSIWVSDVAGRVHLLDARDASVISGTEPLISETTDGIGDINLDIAIASADAVWVANPTDGSVVRVESRDGTVKASGVPGTPSGPSGGTAGVSDVATSDDGAWALTRSGDVHQISGPANDSDLIDLSLLAQVGFAPAGDLAAGGGYVWATGAGDDDDLALFRIAVDDGEVTPAGVTGRFMDLTYGAGFLWALVEDERGAYLVRVDPASAEVAGDPLPLDGRVRDVIVGAGSVWVADQGSGTVLQIDEREEGDPAPVETDEPDDTWPSGAELVFAYAADGDVWAEKRSGERVNVTSSPEEELHPAMAPDGYEIAFERIEDDSTRAVYTMPFSRSGEAQRVAAGSYPAYAPEGHLAWVVRDGDAWQVAVRAAAGGADAVTADLPDVDDVAGLSWTGDSNELVLSVLQDDIYKLIRVAVHRGEDGFTELDVSFPLDVSLPAGTEATGWSSYLAPTGFTEAGGYVLRVCCSDSDPGSMTVELGYVAPSEGGPNYEPIADVSDAATGTDLRSLALGVLPDVGLELTDDGSYRWIRATAGDPGGEEGSLSWVLGTASSFYWVGGPDQLTPLQVDEQPDTQPNSGLSVNPVFVP